ncbi:hypothetical protein DVJ83_03810 [Deinococcus wulumuqiensis]|uniref:Uncharacterized protein n=1 Tax=Deinococcus wulumuqiensis TaxID=980427 RepID=A0A345IFG7_9DEIO|nr:hypothetical protein [Deinococcus wulumuqiensis]AXG98439.1 hypothetical protein DVJ83_03810 [Deinococcus wulumuqiensis]
MQRILPLTAALLTVALAQTAPVQTPPALTPRTLPAPEKPVSATVTRNEPTAQQFTPFKLTRFGKF